MLKRANRLKKVMLKESKLPDRYSPHFSLHDDGQDWQGLLHDLKKLSPKKQHKRLSRRKAVSGKPPNALELDEPKSAKRTGSFLSWANATGIKQFRPPFSTNPNVKRLNPLLYKVVMNV